LRHFLKRTECFQNISFPNLEAKLLGKTDTKNTEEHDISKIDTNGNGKVSIKEAKAAGFKMPITSDHWLYQYMTDADGDCKVGE
jgi:hypothetical protein